MTAEPELSVASRKPRRWPLFLILFLLLAIGGIAFNLWRKKEERRRYNWAKIALPQRMARVPAAWSAATLSDRLQESRKIRDAATFREAAEQVGLKNVAAGSYLLPALAGPLDLAQAFKKGPTHQDVTFPEGFTARQFEARLRKRGFAGAVQMASLPITALEGRLFPDTYTLPLRGTGAELTRTMEDRWKNEMSKLPRPFPKVGGKALDETQLVTLASLVEREAASRAEMPMIAGVILARLRHPMRLQIDASVQYARLLSNLEHKPRLLFSDLKIDSPYNTYLHDGLPPAPICNPGAAALQAAARPHNTTALFYVYSPRTKRHIFAATFEQHKHNIAVARQERRAIENANIDEGISMARE